MISPYTYNSSTSSVTGARGSQTEVLSLSARPQVTYVTPELSGSPYIGKGFGGSLRVEGYNFEDITGIYVSGGDKVYGGNALTNNLTAISAIALFSGSSLSATYPTFSGQQLPVSAYDILSNNTLKMSLCAAESTGKLDIIIANKGGYGILSQDNSDSLGLLYKSNFLAGDDGWTSSAGTVGTQTDVGPDGGPYYNSLKLTAGVAEHDHYLIAPSIAQLEVGLTYTLKGKIYIPSAINDITTVKVWNSNTVSDPLLIFPEYDPNFVVPDTTSTINYPRDRWMSWEKKFVAVHTLWDIWAYDGLNTSFGGDGTEVFYVAEIELHGPAPRSILVKNY